MVMIIKIVKVLVLEYNKLFGFVVVSAKLPSSSSNDVLVFILLFFEQMNVQI